MVPWDGKLKYKQYVELCKAETHDENEYLEQHHYRPRSMFPELVDEPSNLVMLSCGEHLIAHYLLAKELPRPELIRAVNTMCRGLQFGADYCAAEINRLAAAHEAARIKAHDAQCESQILITFPGMHFVKRFSSLKKAEEQMKETTNGFSISTVRNKLCPYRLLSEEEYYDYNRKPIRAFCIRTTVFATHNLHQTFKNISEAATCLGFTEQQICAAIELDEPLNEELNSWRFRYLY